MCSTHFTLSCRILLALPTSNSIVQFLFAEILVEFAWWMLFRPSWCWLFSSHCSSLELHSLGYGLLISRALLPHEGSSYTLFFLFNVLYTKMH